ncbi:hypothetical protein MRX96_051518, partial [Rhipicephalus microplus]
SGTEEHYAEKEQILQDLWDYIRSINYVPRIAPKSSKQLWPQKKSRCCILSGDAAGTSSCRLKIKESEAYKAWAYNSLSMRQMYEFEIRQRELAVENRTLDIEERRLALEESKLALAEKKHELEVTSRQQQRLDFVKHVEQMFDKLSQEVTDLTRKMSGSS